MLLIEDYKLLFIHIQKTGGISVRHLLTTNTNYYIEIGGTHDPIRFNLEKLEKANYIHYYKFAFVRNPYDRLVSWYTMIKSKGRLTPWYEKIIRLTLGKKYLKLWEYVLKNSSTFEEFVKYCTATISDFDGKKSFLWNQFDYISDENENVMLDYIGRFESFNNDLKKIFYYNSIKPIPEIPHFNKSSHSDYKFYYNSVTKSIVTKRYQKDLNHFKYSF